VFRLLDHDECCRAKAGDDAAQFRADTTARAGYEYYLIANDFLDIVEIEPHRTTAKQIFDGHLAQPRWMHAALNDFKEGRDDLGFHARVLAEPGDAGDCFFLRIGNRDDHLANLVVADNFAEVRSSAENRNSLDIHTVQILIVIQEADKGHAAVWT